jgi:3-hydroxyisobutyrate dehydrogenase-like beta-hydroxyacid dehydrogenase
MQRIALLGLGAMGGAMAANWLKKGFPLTIWNRTREKAEGYLARGARVANTPREATQDADVAVAMVSDDAASREVWLGAEGALSNIRAGTICIESSTVTPRWARELSGAARRRGCRFLDVPVGSGRPVAEAGEAILFVGGDAADLAEAQPALDAIAKHIHHLGPIGAGATWKLIANSTIAAQVASLGEAIACARQAGFTADQIATLIKGSSTASPIVQRKLGRMLDGHYDDADFALYLLAKDARYGLSFARELGAPRAVMEAAAEAFSRAEKSGLGAKDCAAIALCDLQKTGRHTSPLSQRRSTPSE